MNSFMEALVSSGRNPQLPEEYNYFGNLVGSWEVSYTNHNIGSSIRGEWHFSWVLEGMAIQDVIILPSRHLQDESHHPLAEYGTSLRIYNPSTHAWDVVYGYTGRIFRLEAKKQDNMIILKCLDDETRMWVFVRIQENHFHWQDITVKEDGNWHINADLFAERVE